jgi:hypothetical protein
MQEALTRNEVINVLGEVDDIVVANIISMGATADELAEARAWMANNEALMNSGKPLPVGRVGQLVEILASIEEESDPLAD